MIEWITGAWDWLCSFGTGFVWFTGVGSVVGVWLITKILRRNNLPREFDSGVVCIDPEVYELAEVALRAYSKPADEERPSDLARGGMSSANGWEPRWFCEPSKDLQALLLTNMSLKRQVLAFRGTVVEDDGDGSPDEPSEPLAWWEALLARVAAFFRRLMSKTRNIRVDADAKWVEVPNIGRMHRGFFRAAEDLLALAKPYLYDEPGWTVDLTGHSLGGAEAVDAAMVLAAGGWRVGKVVTFGAPRVTDREGAERWSKELNVVRVVNDKDAVPLVPIPLPWNGILTRSWVHFGNVLLLANDNGGVSALSPYEARVTGTDSVYWQWATGRRSLLAPLREVSDHKMQNYLDALRVLLPAGAVRRAS